jgi:ATP-dependent DNA helicase PIF1
VLINKVYLNDPHCAPRGNLTAALAKAEPDSTQDEPSSSISYDPSTTFVPADPENEAKDPPLSQQQSDILKRILAGENFFFTGSAGTGKSVLLRAIIRAFREREVEEIRNAPGFLERVWQEYMQSDRKTAPPTVDQVKRWKLGVTASTGMAGV